MAKYIYTFGVMPPYEVFEAQFEAEVGKGAYHYNLKGGDAEVAAEAGIPEEGRFNVDQLFGIIEKLVAYAETEADEEDELEDEPGDEDDEEYVEAPPASKQTYLSAADEDDEEETLGDRALSLASSFLTTLRIEWM
jgi:hypothetical protein